MPGHTARTDIAGAATSMSHAHSPVHDYKFESGWSACTKHLHKTHYRNGNNTHHITHTHTDFTYIHSRTYAHKQVHTRDDYNQRIGQIPPKLSEYTEHQLEQYSTNTHVVGRARMRMRTCLYADTTIPPHGHSLLPQQGGKLVIPRTLRQAHR